MPLLYVNKLAESESLGLDPDVDQRIREAIERVLGNGELRRALIRNGLVEARKQTLDRFIATVLKELNAKVSVESAAVARE